ncbi:hypothetical protein PHMEG_00035108, partial [Phytophthora megakarya]
HVVGDSALVLDMMSQRRRPQATTLVHWYQTTRRLADLCEVVSWTHHCRRHNKAAGWLAKFGNVDRGRSYMTSAEAGKLAAPIAVGLEQLLRGDFSRWLNRQRTGEGEVCGLTE